MCDGHMTQHDGWSLKLYSAAKARTWKQLGREKQPEQKSPPPLVQVLKTNNKQYLVNHRK